MLYNLHTHTYRCNHATGEDREYVESAIKAGMSVLGFSDHCPQLFEKSGYYSFFRMKPGQLEDYVMSVRSLQREYGADIKILLGLETEYYPGCFGRLMEFIEPYGFDYMIMGQHFVGNEYDEADYLEPDGGHGEKYLAQYVSQVIEGLDTGAFTYIAHPDKAYFDGDIEFYNEKMRGLCAHAKKLDIPLEFNMLGYSSGRAYPDPKFWKIAAETGCKAILGYDAHSPSALLGKELYCECLGQLNSMSITPCGLEDIIIRKP